MTIYNTSEGGNFQHILRVLNTNVDGREKIAYALTDIKGVGRRFANLVCKKANVDINKRYLSRCIPQIISLFLFGRRRFSCTTSASYFHCRIHLFFFVDEIYSDHDFFSAGELNKDEIEKIVTILQHPSQFKIPDWFLNRQKDYTTGTHRQLIGNQLVAQFRDDLTRLKKIRYFFRPLVDVSSASSLLSLERSRSRSHL